MTAWFAVMRSLLANLADFSCRGANEEAAMFAAARSQRRTIKEKLTARRDCEVLGLNSAAS